MITILSLPVRSYSLHLHSCSPLRRVGVGPGGIQLWNEFDAISSLSQPNKFLTIQFAVLSFSHSDMFLCTILESLHIIIGKHSQIGPNSVNESPVVSLGVPPHFMSSKKSLEPYIFLLFCYRFRGLKKQVLKHSFLFTSLFYIDMRN